MTRAALFLLCVAPIYTYATPAQDETNESEATFAVAPGIPFDVEALRKVKKEISNASPEQVFAVHLMFDAPERCIETVVPIDAPILAPSFDSSLNQLPRLDNEDFREYAFRVLATLPPDSAVTIQLKLDFPATVDLLASLVWQYGIEGMSAELVPERSDKRLIATPELSIHGDSLGDQVKRARCQMRLGIGPHTKGEWYADWVSVSMPLDKAWVFLSYPGFSQAKIVGKFPRSDLERLIPYFERRSEHVYEMPESYKVPPDCGDYYRHP